MTAWFRVISMTHWFRDPDDFLKFAMLRRLIEFVLFSWLIEFVISQCLVEFVILRWLIEGDLLRVARLERGVAGLDPSTRGRSPVVLEVRFRLAESGPSTRYQFIIITRFCGEQGGWTTASWLCMWDGTVLQRVWWCTVCCRMCSCRILCLY